MLELEAGGGLVVPVEGMTGGCVLELEAGGGLVVPVEGMTGGCVGTGSRGWVGGPSGGDDRRVCVGTGSRGWVGDLSGGDDRRGGGVLVVPMEGMTGGCVFHAPGIEFHTFPE